MTEPSMTADELWRAVTAERRALADDLAGLADADWQHGTLCDRWTVEQVVAHLTAGAVTTPFRWIRSVVAAGFDFDKHNDARLAEQLGDTPAETLAWFRATADRRGPRIGPPAEGALGELIIHAQDLRRPLGIATTPAIETTTVLAGFLARTDFTVPSRKTITGLRLTATDGPFETGTGPLVSGPTLALVLVMGGRPSYTEDLDGPGVDQLRDQCLAANKITE
ncbi:maleylpyruvate isomerase family mycothiol-dependent enzyme [Microlunatus sp. GCM10028923]|uniref:maleylpyruvate isomerase family mycothiol-dependent enzyme n=1 Tax=Microlunatus sp. GCM10028923 TaxID=3273400 RepID=UPI003619B3FE